ncbi:hypothetical protein BWR58_00015 [Shigella sonnei]|nr:hypothetical protein BWR58_00015 [Shigella sonnei]
MEAVSGSRGAASHARDSVYYCGWINVKVLSAQHVDVLSGVRTLRKQHVGWSGQSKWRITVLYHWR